MTMDLTWTLSEMNGAVRAVLTGAITEASAFAPLLAELKGRVVLDLEGIDHVNSFGVREWIRFMTALREQTSEIVLERCSVPVVQQFHMVPNFLGRARVRSVFAPYFCSACNNEHSVLVPLEPGVPVRMPAPPLCPNCNGPLEFDDIAEQFFSFRVV
jgi:anti-anti-sigma regulatory factor